jgi:hypothetical protein
VLPAIPYRSLPMDDTPHRPPLCVTEAQTGLHLLDILAVRSSKFQVPGTSSLPAACVEQVLSIIGSHEPRHMLPGPCFMGPRNSPVGQKDSVFLHTFLFHGSHGKPICMSQM